MITVLRNNTRNRNVNKALKVLNEYLRYITKSEMLVYLDEVTKYLKPTENRNPTENLNPLIYSHRLIVRIKAGKITTTQVYQFLFFVLAHNIFSTADELTAYIDLYGKDLVL